MTSTARTLTHRPRRRVPATISAVLLLAVAVTAGWAAVQYLATGATLSVVRTTRDGLAAITWGSVWVLLIGIAVSLLGLWWLIFALKPGPPNAVTLAVTGSDRVRDAGTVLTRPALARLAAATARDLDGVDRVATRIGRRSVSLRVDTTLHDTATLTETVRTALTETFTRCGIEPLPSLSVHVTREEA